MVIAFPVKNIIGLFSNVHIFPGNIQISIYQWIMSITIIWQYQVPFSWVSPSSSNYLLILTMPSGDIFHWSVLLAQQLGLREVARLVSRLRIHKQKPGASASALLGGAMGSLTC